MAQFSAFITKFWWALCSCWIHSLASLSHQVEHQQVTPNLDLSPVSSSCDASSRYFHSLNHIRRIPAQMEINLENGLHCCIVILIIWMEKGKQWINLGSGICNVNLSSIYIWSFVFRTNVIMGFNTSQVHFHSMT